MLYITSVCWLLPPTVCFWLSRRLPAARWPHSAVVALWPIVAVTPPSDHSGAPVWCTRPLCAFAAVRGPISAGEETWLTKATSFLHRDYDREFCWWEARWEGIEVLSDSLTH